MYRPFLEQIRDRIRTAQVKAALGKGRTIVEHTLRDLKSPIGVAQYRLLPAKLKQELPPISRLKNVLENLQIPAEDE